MKKKIKYWLIAFVSSIGLFFIFGIPTAIIPNYWFTRMTPVNYLDWIFLIVSSLLLGVYLALHLYKRKNVKKCNRAVASGGIGSILAFGCPICNQLLVFLFGTTALLNYFEPFQPILGFISIILLSFALYWRWKT